MTTTAAERCTDLGDIDQRVRLHGASWADYERLLEVRGERSVPRITYLQGELELMSPSARHEAVAENLGALLLVWAAERRIDLQPLGTTTWRSSAADRGAEADKSFVLGREPASWPDLVIEVIVTSSGLDKLEVYRGLRVPEVWFWRAGRLSVHVLRDTGYEAAARSTLLPDVDLVLLARLAERPTPTRTIRLLRRLLTRIRRRNAATP